MYFTVIPKHLIDSALSFSKKISPCVPLLDFFVNRAQFLFIPNPLKLPSVWFSLFT